MTSRFVAGGQRCEYLSHAARFGLAGAAFMAADSRA